MTVLCAGCRNEITDRRHLKCVLCNGIYDLDCANVSEKRFYNTMSPESKALWKCPLCRSKEPKGDRNNSPIRPYIGSDVPLFVDNSTKSIDVSVSYEDSNNVTLRRKPPHRIIGSDTLSADDSMISPPGHTFMYESIKTKDAQVQISPSELLDEQITLKNFKSILHENNEYVLSVLQISIKNQLKTAISEIKAEFQHTHDKICTDQEKIKLDITNINTVIDQLNSNCLKLKAENDKIKKEIFDLKTLTQHNMSPSRNDKIVVLHGLSENYWETEAEVINRIINIFYDLLNINISGYIEEISFIGKKGKKRPIKIELISKRTKSFLLENSSYLQEAGLNVTDFLSPADLKMKRELREGLITARQDGHHAVIRNNQLIVNGKIVLCAPRTPITTNRNSPTRNASMNPMEPPQYEKIMQSTGKLLQLAPDPSAPLSQGPSWNAVPSHKPSTDSKINRSEEDERENRTFRKSF